VVNQTELLHWKNRKYERFVPPIHFPSGRSLARRKIRKSGKKNK